MMEGSKVLRPSLVLISTVMNAVLYAVLSFATAYIPSPWGVGQFRPAVVVPFFFASVFGPMCGGVGAALGTLLVDSFKHGQLYMGSLLAAVPGNFIGFYLFGRIVKRFSWSRFIYASLITLTVANVVVAFLYVFLFKVLYLGSSKYVEMSFDIQVFFSIGLTIWWFVTMLPFVLLITPLLIRAAASAFPSIVSEEIRRSGLEHELPHTSFSLAMLVPGVIMLILGLTASYSHLGVYTTTFFGEATSYLIQLMFYVSGAVLTVFGTLFYVRKSVTS